MPQGQGSSHGTRYIKYDTPCADALKDKPNYIYTRTCIHYKHTALVNLPVRFTTFQHQQPIYIGGAHNPDVTQRVFLALCLGMGLG